MLAQLLQLGTVRIDKCLDVDICKGLYELVRHPVVPDKRREGQRVTGKYQSVHSKPIRQAWNQIPTSATIGPPRPLPCQSRGRPPTDTPPEIDVSGAD